MARPAGRSSGLVVLATLLVACDSGARIGDPVAPSAGGAPELASASTEIPTPTLSSPSPVPLVLDAVAVDLVEPCPFEIGDACELAAGTYASSRFTPRIRFAVADGWTLRFHMADLLELVGPGLTTLSLQSRPAVARDGPPLADPGAVIDRLRSLDGVDVHTPNDTTFLGQPALAFDMSAERDIEGAFVIERASTEHDRFVWLVPGGSRSRYVVTTLDGDVVVLTAVAVPSDGFDAMLAAVEPAVP